MLCDVNREEVQYCDNNCQKYVSLWEANNHSESPLQIAFPETRAACGQVSLAWMQLGRRCSQRESPETACVDACVDACVGECAHRVLGAHPFGQSGARTRAGLRA